MTLTKREDAIKAIKKEIQDFEKNYMHGEDDENFEHDIGFVAGLHRAKTLIRSLPSAEAEPTVIRSKTLLPTKDFKEWAKRVRETNPNAIVIPCDAEVVSADAVQGEWIEKGGELVCSVCGNSVSFSRTPKGWALGKFCQSCGTRMKGGTT